ncbi:MAG: nodulation protein NfeD, partial [Firmicutes bacterium]|nr:nodulation protein NfeD [Bacillota bacterium]
REIAIEGLVNGQQLLTLTSKEAEELNFTDGVFATREELLSALNLTGAELTEIALSPAEKLARFITNPTIATLLLVIGLAAMIIEIIMAGFGAAGVISILAFVLYFGGHVIAGLAGNEVIILFILGIVLLLAEVVIPGFGVIGIAGIVSLCASIILSAPTAAAGIQMLIVALLLTSIIVAILFRRLKRSPVWSQIILQYAETKDRGYVGTSDYSHLIGQVGETLTTLRPAGTVEINGQRLDVVSEGGFIAQGTPVKVVKVEGVRIIVRAN